MGSIPGLVVHCVGFACVHVGGPAMNRPRVSPCLRPVAPGEEVSVQGVWWLGGGGGGLERKQQQNIWGHM